MSATYALRKWESSPKRRDGDSSPGRLGDTGSVSRLPTVAISSLRSRSGPSARLVDTKDALRSPGEPLESVTRSYMESRFRHDFGSVRVHAEPEAAESARAANALAYTIGTNIVFGRGMFAPETTDGRSLLAHELAHTIQQTAKGSRDSSTRSVTPGHESLEREADAAMEGSTMAITHLGQIGVGRSFTRRASMPSSEEQLRNSPSTGSR